MPENEICKNIALPYRYARYGTELAIEGVFGTQEHKMLLSQITGIEADPVVLISFLEKNNDPNMIDMGRLAKWPDGIIMVGSNSDELGYPKKETMEETKRVTMELLSERYPDLIFRRSEIG